MFNSINKKHKIRQRGIILVIRLAKLDKSVISRLAELKAKEKVIFLEGNMVLPIKHLDAYTLTQKYNSI